MHSCEGFLQIALTRGIGDAALKRIMLFMQEKRISWVDLCNDDALLHSLFGHKGVMLEDMYAKRDIAKRIAEKLRQESVGIMFHNEDSYPLHLRHTLKDKCPAFLFYKGNMDILNKNAVGFCGSRKVSSKGLNIARDCVRQLVMNDIAITSGYAAGTDMATHQSALQCAGQTVFVLPEGILKSRVKPEVKELLNEENHIFISQFLPETIWSAGNAMKRNGVIIGLAKAMILVESGKTGGTFAAGRETLSMRRPLFVVDFAQPDISAEANAYFIEKGGIPIRGRDGVPNISKVFLAIQSNPLQYDSRINSDQLMLNVG